MRRKWDGETCKLCQREQRLAWSVKDEIWKKVVSKKYQKKVICFECFLKLADEKNIKINTEDLLYFNWVGNNNKLIE